MQFQDGERSLLFNKQQEERVLCVDLLIKVRHNKEKAGGGLRQERGRRLTLSWRGETVGMLLLRGKEESGEAARSQRGQVFRLIMSTSHNLMLTGELDC